MPFRASIVALLLLAALTSLSAIAAEDLKNISTLVSQGKHAQALEQVDEYLGENPGDVQGQFLRGVILAEQNKSDEAIRVFSTLTEQHPELPEPYNNLAVLYAEQGQYEKARKALEQAIRTHPSYATAHENLGDIYAKMATDAYDKALQLDQDNTRAQTKLALVKELFSGNGSAVQAGKTAKTVKTAALASPSKPAEQPVKKPVAKPVAAPVEPAAKPAATAEKEKPAAPAPAAATSVVTPVSTANENPDPATAAISDSVKSWAKAWSAQDVDAYLAHYARNFKTPDGESRSAWEKTRRTRINAPRSITVEVSGFKVVSIDDSHAKVSFSQRYKAGRLAQRTSKMLVMQKSGEKWLIEQEQVSR